MCGILEQKVAVDPVIVDIRPIVKTISFVYQRTNVATSEASCISELLLSNWKLLFTCLYENILSF